MSQRKTPFLPFACLLLSLSLGACTGMRQWMIGIFGDHPPQAQAAPGELAGEFTDADKDRRQVKVTLRPVAADYVLVTDIQYLPGDNERAVVLLKSGELYLHDFAKDKRQLIRKFEVATSSELGLLGFAFHPKFPETAKVYLNLTPQIASGQKSEVAEFSWQEAASGEVSLADRRLLLSVDQPYANHNAGQIKFGPDGYLYVGWGDGGWRDDPHGHGQNRQTMLGAMLRIDVQAQGEKPYGIPKDNPFVSDKQVLDEIWAYGLRNPWRYSFAPDGRLIVADVGQDKWEEISVVSAGDDMGWKTWEGRNCFIDKRTCANKPGKKPFVVYPRQDGGSITGGYLYTSKKVPELTGKYVFGDFVSGKIWAVPLPKTGEEEKDLSGDMLALGAFGLQISTFALRPDGEVLVGDYATGRIYSIEKL